MTRIQSRNATESSTGAGVTDLKVGAFPPLVGPAPAPETLASFVGAAADAGLDHIAVGDHVSFRVGAGADALLSATAIAMSHPWMPVYVGVYLLPLRHPTLVARQVADLELLAPGRLVLGIGLGGEDPHEFECCGIDPRTRGRRTDEAMALLRALLTGDPVTHHGEFFAVENALISPPPRARVPLIVGGRSDAAVRRAARLGDGWLAIWASPRRFAEAVASIDEQAEAAGRTHHPREHALQVWCGIDDDARRARALLAEQMERFYQMPFERFERYSPSGTPHDVADFLAPYVAAGCQTFNLIPQSPDLATAAEGAAEVKRLLAKVAPARIAVG
jgi:alkanesulfonate monooxygenase SsuD/methylene tetrahydromethanopterin reductase-like flavin-dependent oxidoreductase (luciferase family)